MVVVDYTSAVRYVVSRARARALLFLSVGWVGSFPLLVRSWLVIGRVALGFTLIRERGEGRQGGAPKQRGKGSQQPAASKLATRIATTNDDSGGNGNGNVMSCTSSVGAVRRLTRHHDSAATPSPSSFTPFQVLYRGGLV